MSSSAAVAVELLRIALASGDHARLREAARLAIEELAPSSLSSLTVLTPAQLVAKIAARDNHLRIVVASGSESGKTVLVSALVRALKDAKMVKVVCALTSDQAGAEEMFGSLLTAGCNIRWSEAELERILAERAKIKAEGMKNPPTLIILDDLAGEKDAKNSAAINALYTRGRHFELIPAFLNQVANTELSPKVRDNSNLIFFSRLSKPGVKILYNSFSGMRPPMSEKEFEAWVHELPDFTFGVYDRIGRSLSRVRAAKPVRAAAGGAGAAPDAPVVALSEALKGVALDDDDL